VEITGWNLLFFFASKQEKKKKKNRDIYCFEMP